MQIPGTHQGDFLQDLTGDQQDGLKENDRYQLPHNFRRTMNE